MQKIQKPFQRKDDKDDPFGTLPVKKLFNSRIFAIAAKRTSRAKKKKNEVTRRKQEQERKRKQIFKQIKRRKTYKHVGVNNNFT
jgi:hypothetical protein